MSKREILHLELTFTPNVSFNLMCMFAAADTDSLTLDTSVVLGSESSLSGGCNGPRCGDASPTCNVLLLGKVTLLIPA